MTSRCRSTTLGGVRLGTILPTSAKWFSTPWPLPAQATFAFWMTSRKLSHFAYSRRFWRSRAHQNSTPSSTWAAPSKCPIRRSMGPSPNGSDVAPKATPASFPDPGLPSLIASLSRSDVWNECRTSAGSCPAFCYPPQLPRLLLRLSIRPPNPPREITDERVCMRSGALNVSGGSKLREPMRVRPVE